MVSPPDRRYVSGDDDSARWGGFPFREGDVVVSTRSKSGTTWVQLMCTMLVLGRAELPAPLGSLSPWLDHTIEPVQEVIARLEMQMHRRVIKTHTPLDGLPLDDRATYVVVGRNPLDMALSLYHQGDNLDRQRLAELTGAPARPQDPRPTAHDWLVSWTTSEATASEQPDSLAGVVHHAADAWSRLDSGLDIVLVHYADLLADLPTQVARLAERLDVDASPQLVTDIAREATFERMRARSADLAPNRLGVLKDTTAFFRSGRSGGGAALLSAAELATYHERVARLAPEQVIDWLCR